MIQQNALSLTPKNMRKFTTIILLSSAFFLLSSEVQGQNPDISGLKIINNSSSIPVSQFISNSTTYIAAATPLVLGITALIEKDDKMLKNAVYVAASLGVDGVLTYGLKKAIARPRPFNSYPQDIQAYENVSSLSFPSGHSSLAFVTATALSIKYPKWYVIAPSFLWASSVGYSRMNLGVHYPTDVLAGAMLGAGSAYITHLANNWFWKKKENKKLIGLQVY
jgi:membrane-associated phospholipid phosphatase